MYEIRRSPAALAAEQEMPESLAVAFGAYLDQLADDPWATGEPWKGPSDRPQLRVGTFGFSGRGIVMYRIDMDLSPPQVLLVRLMY